MKITGLQTSFNDSNMITSYFLNVGSVNIMLDIGSKGIPLDLVAKTDILILSHEHGDHICGLYSKDIVKELVKKKTQIFATKTTIELLSYQLRKNSSLYSNDKEYKHLADSLYGQMNHLYYETPRNINHVTITLFKAGHTFGSSMVLLETLDGTLLYTGDFSKNDDLSQYSNDAFSYSTSVFESKVDFILLDGTKWVKSKSSSTTTAFNEIKDKIKWSKDSINIPLSRDKIIISSFVLNSINGVKGQYGIYLPTFIRPYLSILLDSLYYPFISDEIMLELDEDEKHFFELSKYTSSLKKITFSPNNESIYNHAFSLHATSSEIRSFINSFKGPLKVIVSHYNQSKVEAAKEICLENSTNDVKYILLEDKEIIL